MSSTARASALLMGLALAACGGPPATTTTATPDPPPARTPAAAPDVLDAVPGRAPTEAEARAMRRLSRVAESIRSLRFRRDVPFRVQSRAVITQFVRDQIDAAELEQARIFYVALGLIPPDLAIQELLVRVLGEQIVGYYDPEQSLMVVREDVAEQLGGQGDRDDAQLGEAEMVIVHELVHALQDQRLGLGDLYEQERTIDGENAFAALVEGDATLAMIGHMIAQQGGQPLSSLTRNVALLRMLIRDSPESMRGQEMESAPPIIRIPLVARYLDGLIFNASLHGQSGWNAVNDAYRTLPVSTEQVLHPARYDSGELPDEVRIPQLPELRAGGLTPHDEDTLGELEASIWFGLGVPDAPRVASAAEGWGGDRLRVYRDGAGSSPVVWFTSWDDEGEAREAQLAAEAAAAAVDAPGGHPPFVERRGRAVLVLIDLAPALQPAARAGFHAFAAALSPTPPRRLSEESTRASGLDARGH